MRHTSLIATAAIFAMIAPSVLAKPVLAKPAAPMSALTKAVAASHRSAANRARDTYRHPQQTLTFFGVKPSDNVVEVYPGGGWYTEILAPYLAPSGKLTTASPVGKSSDQFNKLLGANQALYGKVVRANFPAAPGAVIVAPGSADVVLTFRNVHNWRFGGVDAAQAAFDQIYAMLKPGGTLGVVEHRLPEEMVSAMEEKSGYMKRSSVVRFATRAGFKLVDESNINANPKDTHNWPDGVWSLPPVYQHGNTDRAKYAAIGESDRMTLKFTKPK